MHNREEIDLRTHKIQEEMQKAGIDLLVISTNVNLLYLFGQIVSGVAIVPLEGAAQLFFRKPVDLAPSDFIHKIKRLEEVTGYIQWEKVNTVAYELDEIAYSELGRLRKLLPEEKKNVAIANATSCLRAARMIKTPLEIEKLRANAQKHISVYQQIPSLYRQGMTDRALQIEIERAMRRAGSVGIFRTFGNAMEIFMGSLIAGDNAAAASPYDFAMGGAGCVALPLGSADVLLEEGNAVMIDMAGNYSEYITDMTRVFSVGKLSDEAYRLHELSLRMHREIMQKVKPGDSCAEVYLACLALAEKEQALDVFMGSRQQAQFVGHGLGLQINELPVLTTKSKDTFQEGMTIAFEPKFIARGEGAVGVENTYLVTSQGVENLTPMPEEIVPLG